MKRYSKLICLALLLLVFPLSAAKLVVQTKIRGIGGELLKNVQERLKEFALSTSLLDESDAAISEQITQATMPYGYFTPTATITRKGKKLTIFIKPGKPVKVRSLVIQIHGEGESDPKILEACSQFTLKAGMIMDSSKYEQGKQNLIDTAAAQGFLNAAFTKAEVLVDRVDYSARIHLIFNTGQRYYFGQMRFSPSYISPDLLRRYVPFEYGQVFSAQKLIEFNDILAGSGYFKEVTVNPDINSERFVPINVALKNASRFNYTLGVGYGTDTGPRGRAGVQIMPVNPHGDKFNALAIGSLRQNTVQGQYLIPGRNPLTDEMTFTGNFSNLDYRAGDSNSLLFSVTQRYHIQGYERSLSINGLWERYRYWYQTDKTERSTAYPKINLNWSNAGSDLFTPTGYRVRVSALGASKALLSQISVAQGIIDARAAITVPALRTRFHGHTVQGVTAISNINDLPLSLAMLLGGADNMKGYSFNAIGPGKRMNYGGIEIQKETVDNWYLIGFFDIGNVYDPSPSFWQRDAGAGLMWVSPLGPIKIAVAQAIDKDFRRIGGNNPRLVVSMGPDI